jgi:hypothetical protein
MGLGSLKTPRFVYTSSIPASRYHELAELMFFNLRQDRFRDDIVNAIELYGLPEIVTTDQSLRFSVEKLGQVQSLYAFDGNAQTGRLAGAMVYARVSDEKIVLLHMGLADPYQTGGPLSHKMLALKMIQQLKKVGKTLKGVHRLEILYGRRAAALRL